MEVLVLLNVELFELVGIIPDFEYPLLKAFWSVLIPDLEMRK